jgi:hypothetical protein
MGYDEKEQNESKWEENNEDEGKERRLKRS